MSHYNVAHISVTANYECVRTPPHVMKEKQWERLAVSRGINRKLSHILFRVIISYAIITKVSSLSSFPYKTSCFSRQIGVILQTRFTDINVDASATFWSKQRTAVETKGENCANSSDTFLREADRTIETVLVNMLALNLGMNTGTPR
jgi:hypothetical protein